MVLLLRVLHDPVHLRVSLMTAACLKIENRISSPILPGETGSIDGWLS